MGSNATGEYIFVEVKAKDKGGSISRGTKISHALRRHHRAARRELTRKHLASRRAACAFPPHDAALPRRVQVSPTPDVLQEHFAQLKHHDTEQGRVCELELLQPLKLKALLGQGRLDPFNVYPAENICLYIHEVLDHAVKYTWPGVSPFGHPSSNQVARAWLGCAMANPVAFYSFVFAAGLHHAYEHGWDNIPNRAYGLLFSYKTKAISLVNEALQHIKTETSDALLVSILILAAHGPRRIVVSEESREQHPLSPLANTQSIGFYGSLRFDGLHMDALRLLLARKGGLHTIQLYSLAETIGFGELLGSSEHLAPPTLPESFSCPTTIIPAVPDPVPINFFPCLQKRMVFRDLLPVLGDIAAICKALSRFDNEKKGSPFFNDMIRTRNTVQHRILSLPRRDFILVSDHAIYEACRLAAMIFGAMIIFPLPRATNIKARLAGMLRWTLERLPSELESTSQRQILLWAFMLGAIAASNSKGDRDWYCMMIKKQSRLLGIEQWSDIQVMMNNHLWFDRVCDPPTQKIWAGAMAVND
ncbi:hypothetical protein H2200_002449 [Cladophialophora chaetospira]|uniref:Uncharacterized protein n=1 Tax=Cladophialophora chaetospira TaxID=386627 RepID=A0AA38XJQ0_9EURO|nr:hypothetical protein H2200_002449 [Cladophialophora chaetospira]